MNIQKVFNRKKQLIERDPLFKEYEKTINKIKDIKVFEEINQKGQFLNWHEEARAEHEEKYPDHWKFIKLGGELGFKWFMDFKIDWSSKIITLAPYTNPETIWIGSAPTITGYEGVILSHPDKFPNLEWLPYPNPFNKEPILAEINEFVNPGEKGRKTWLPILIDLQRLNKSSAKQLKKIIWEIIDARIPKGQKIFSGSGKENPECLFLHSLRDEKTFQKYLNWYDLNIGTDYQKPNGYSFRAIALCEEVRLKHPEKYEAAKTQIANSTKVIRSSKGKRTLRGIVGEPIKGEDAVGKGVKLIYSAIHRKLYPSKKTKQKKYNCPIHGISCQDGCSYKDDFLKDFNRRNMLFKPLNSLSPEVLEQVVDDYSQPKRKKQKKLD